MTNIELPSSDDDSSVYATRISRGSQDRGRFSSDSTNIKIEHCWSSTERTRNTTIIISVLVRLNVNLTFRERGKQALHHTKHPVYFSINNIKTIGQILFKGTFASFNRLVKVTVNCTRVRPQSVKRTAMILFAKLIAICIFNGCFPLWSILCLNRRSL